MELIDHDEAEPVAKFRDERRPTIGRPQEVAGVSDHRVEGSASPTASGRLDVIDATIDKSGDLGGFGPHPQARIGHGEPPRHRLAKLPNGRRRRTSDSEQPVVDDFGDVDRCTVDRRRQSAGGTEDALAETVDRRDGHRVDIGQRLPEAADAGFDLGPRSGGESEDDFIGSIFCSAPQRCLGRLNPLPKPTLEFGRCRLGEGDNSEASGGDRALS